MQGGEGVIQIVVVGSEEAPLQQVVAQLGAALATLPAATVGGMPPPHSIQLSDPQQALPAAALSAPLLCYLLTVSTWRQQLAVLTRQRSQRQGTLLLLGLPAGEAALHAALRAGARELLPLPVVVAQLRQLLPSLLPATAAASRRGELLVLLGSRGGNGCSLVAANLAVAIAQQRAEPVALLDLDTYAGTLRLQLDLTTDGQLRSALQHADQLDSVALNGYMLRHREGVHLLCGDSRDEPLLLSALPTLLQLLRRSYRWVVVDLPRCALPLSDELLLPTDRLLLLLQQRVVDLESGRRLRQQLRRAGVASERLFAVVNRARRSAVVTDHDLLRALQLPRLWRLRNDHAAAIRTTELGVPLTRCAPRSPLTRDLNALARTLIDPSAAPVRHWWQGWPMLSRASAASGEIQ